MPTWSTPITDAGDEERHADHRLDPLLAQNRVQHFCLVDVVEDDRPLARGYAAREAAADRDSHAGFDLFLDSDRRASDKLIGLLVEQEDRAGVGAEDVADPRQQHTQQLLDFEMRERGVSDGLEPLQPIGTRPRDPAPLGLHPGRTNALWITCGNRVSPWDPIVDGAGAAGAAPG